MPLFRLLLAAIAASTVSFAGLAHQPNGLEEHVQDHEYRHTQETQHDVKDHTEKGLIHNQDGSLVSHTHQQRQYSPDPFYNDRFYGRRGYGRSYGRSGFSGSIGYGRGYSRGYSSYGYGGRSCR